MAKAPVRHRWGLCAACSPILLAACFGPLNPTFAQSDDAPDASRGSSFSLPKEDDAFKTALEDFERYRDKKQWPAAFRALTTIEDTPPKGFSSTNDGFLIPSGDRVRASLLTLPPEGLEAYRLFFDAKAKQLYGQATAKPSDDADAPAIDDVPLLRKITDDFFLTTPGAQAADRLGDAYFEAGSYAAADDVWRTILDQYPDSQLPPVRLFIKRATALARMQRWPAFDALAQTVAVKFPGESITIAGQSQEVGSYLQSLRTATPTTEPAGTTPGRLLTGLPASDKEAWQSIFLSDEVGKTWRDQFAQTGLSRFMDSLDMTVPASAVDDDRVYVNWMGVVFAIDLKTGKLVWRSNKFSDLVKSGLQMSEMGIDTAKYCLLRASQHLYAVGRYTQIQDQARPLRCFDPKIGKELWATTTGPLSSCAFFGEPVAVDDTLYVVMSKSNSAAYELIALDAGNGAQKWSMPLGSAVGSTNFRGQQMLPVPVLKFDAGSLYVMTNNGAMLSVDIDAHAVRWALKTEAPPMTDGQQIFFSGDDEVVTRIEPPGTIVAGGGLIYLKETKTHTLYAVDPAGPKVVWHRPLEKEESPTALRDGRLLISGAAAGSLDPATHALQWSTTLITQTGHMQPVFSKDAEMLFAARGLYVISTATGDVQKIWRGADRDAAGGTLWVSGGKLISISNRAVTAYPLVIETGTP